MKQPEQWQFNKPLPQMPTNERFYALAMKVHANEHETIEDALKAFKRVYVDVMYPVPMKENPRYKSINVMRCQEMRKAQNAVFDHLKWA